MNIEFVKNIPTRVGLASPGDVVQVGTQEYLVITDDADFLGDWGVNEVPVLDLDPGSVMWSINGLLESTKCIITGRLVRTE